MARGCAKDGIREPGPNRGPFTACFLPVAAGVAFGIAATATWAESHAAATAALAVSGLAVGVATPLGLLGARIMLSRQRSFAIERAVATASHALLKRDVPDPVGTALAALREGARVPAVFLETNTGDDLDEYGNMQSVRDILYGETDQRADLWELTGWQVSAGAQHALAAGDLHETDPRTLDKQTRTIYDASRIEHEILAPITVEGRWVGSLGLISRDADRTWSADEQRLLRLAAEMVGTYWERREAKARLEEMIRSKDEFIASISHEVRTPLTAVVGFAHELNDSPERFGPLERSELVGLIAMHSQEVANIVDDLLIAARADAGTIVMVPEDISVSAVVGDVLAVHSGNVEYSTAANCDLQVSADPVRMRQILRNLLTNAERYGGDAVRVHVVEIGDMVAVRVMDNGEGIPLRQRDRVFEPYSRAVAALQPPASVGLGLSVARKLAELMGGTLQLGREHGWTIFSLSLPAVRNRCIDEDDALQRVETR